MTLLILRHSDGVSETTHAHSRPQPVYRAILLCGLHGGSVGGAGGPRVAPLPVVHLGAHATGTQLLLAAPRERLLADPERPATRRCVLLPEDRLLEWEGGTTV
jgi:hypothetical protein